ncbi:N-acetyl-gamma-glutamyl-phosphate reductase [Spirochaeta lutea]|uniref:N-acetyl-gamma-glutamyl-phosphate reductase n=1 Tax=Spirochaeta lutea TaxID=1480694 RepID=A0A098R0I8_9SPIO|nr:N-acetyl-gamma-glutamyl-phosphate reductase [Spirochaeta lutea]KGE73459.1 N-acetyl-gamma-glutamyl-phosphate reductase [Spirochaeta lutea]
MKAVILGTTGYTGQVLLRLLSNHPKITRIYPVSSSIAGTPLLEFDPGLGNAILEKTKDCGNAFCTLDQAVEAQGDVVFAALPHLKSAQVCAPFFGQSVVIDLSADFRIKDHSTFIKAYGQEPPRPDLLAEAVYGLAEWNRDQITKASLIANPGCYPTASLTPLLPLISQGYVAGDVIINAMSGISGAGRKAKENLLFCERTETVNAYSPGTSHRHCQEIQQEVSLRTGKAQQDSTVYFTPHLVPIKQGMAVTTTCQLNPGVSDAEIAQAYKAAYQDSPWIRIVPAIPDTSQVRGTNRCDVHWHRDGDRIFLMSVIDNLYKGASGQAVQNMNIRFGFDERTGLPEHGEV